MTALVPVILAGGSGTRLWPLSRTEHPKQFLPLLGERTMLQLTLDRLGELEHRAPIVVCNESHRFLAAEQLRTIGIGDARLLLEPAVRNTAPAIALAALEARRDGEDPLLLILAADHHLPDSAAFANAVEQARSHADAGLLMTFGVTPVRAETGYGYIQCGAALDAHARRIHRFIEKPDQATAETLLEDGNHLWNSGMFLFRASRYLEELERLQPLMLRACIGAMDGSRRDADFIRADAEAFATSPSQSIDYAVMEQTEQAGVVPLTTAWSDLGSWAALQETGTADADGNVCTGDVLLENSRQSLVHATSRLVAVLGVDDLTIVETPDAVLVMHRDKAQQVRDLVAQLESAGRSEHRLHREVHRPWGKYDSIGNGDRFQVKHITVLPGRRLSLQMHHHRAEHWIVVRGTAKVTNGDKTYLVSEDESTYVPLGRIHSLENPGQIPLEMIEVQSGAYLGEDDIIRFDEPPLAR